ncbi:hypothetical protein QOT17_025157 [Balamuthia mandrillaris]
MVVGQTKQAGLRLVFCGLCEGSVQILTQGNKQSQSKCTTTTSTSSTTTLMKVVVVVVEEETKKHLWVGPVENAAEEEAFQKGLAKGPPPPPPPPPRKGPKSRGHLLRRMLCLHI